MERSEKIATATREKYFTPDIMMQAFGPDFLDEELCREWILKSLHPEEPTCPGCNKMLPDTVLSRFWEAERVKCPFCGKFFTALTGTFLQGGHMSFPELFLLAVLIEAGVSTEAIAHKLNASAETIRIWRRKFRELLSSEI